MIPHSKPWITLDDQHAVNEIMNSGMIAEGYKVKQFEIILAEYLGANDVVATGSGTAAIIFALLSLEINTGDEVIIPTYVCDSVSKAVRAVGAIPVLCDVTEHWVMDPECVRNKITNRTKAIIVVHTFGIAADIEAFLELGIPIIEDSCQAFGGMYKGRPLGLTGTIGIFSFHATKCLTTGEGGAVVSRDVDIMNRIKKMKEQKVLPAPMTDLQAVLGISQLSRYNDFLKYRRRIAETYIEMLPPHFTEQIRKIKSRTMFFRFPLRMKWNDEFDDLKKWFDQRGIQVRRGVDELLHRRIGLVDREFENAVRCYNETLSIPILPFFTQENVNQIILGVMDYERIR